jgi:hypothetical protein
MKNSKFTKAPLNSLEKEEKIQAFISLSDAGINKKDAGVVNYKKEKAKALYLRAPESLWNDIHEIMARTGLSMNAICIDSLRLEMKRKLREIRED